MTTNRRKLLKVAALGGASLALNSRSFFFPKPVNAYSINYLLSLEGRSDSIFQNLLQADIARDPSEILLSNDRAIILAVEAKQQEFTNRNFNINPTPYAQRLSNSNNPLWGRQRQEELGPNPGFATIQVVNNRASSISFTGSTTVGIDSAIRILGTDENLDPRALDYALIPVEEQFEDWGTWVGDLNPRTGEVLPSSLTRYGTRYGHVLRRYQVVEPRPGGFGVITLFVDGGSRVKSQIDIRVDFV